MKGFIRKWHQRHSRQSAAAGFPPIKPLSELLLSETRLVVLDLETNGFSVAKDDVVAIGAVAIEGGEIHLSDQVDLILRRPDVDIRDTVLIHGIGPQALSRGHDSAEAFRYLLNWINGDPLLAYCVPFDQPFLEKALRKQLKYRQNHGWLDVELMLPMVFPQQRLRRKSLDDWAEYFGLQVSERHNAAADAMVTAELTLIALHYAQQQGIKTVAELSDCLQVQRKLHNLSFLSPS